MGKQHNFYCDNLLDEVQTNKSTLVIIPRNTDEPLVKHEQQKSKTKKKEPKASLGRVQKEQKKKTRESHNRDEKKRTEFVELLVCRYLKNHGYYCSLKCLVKESNLSKVDWEQRMMSLQQSTLTKQGKKGAKGALKEEDLDLARIVEEKRLHT